MRDSLTTTQLVDRDSDTITDSIVEYGDGWWDFSDIRIEQSKSEVGFSWLSTSVGD